MAIIISLLIIIVDICVAVIYMRKKKYSEELMSKLYSLNEQVPHKIRSGSSIDRKYAIGQIQLFELDKFIKRQWKKDFLEWKPLGSLPDDFSKVYSIDVMIRCTDGSEHRESIVPNWSNTNEYDCKGFSYWFTTKENDERNRKELEERKIGLEKVNSIAGMFVIPDRNANKEVWKTNEEFVKYGVAIKASGISEAIDEYEDFANRTDFGGYGPRCDAFEEYMSWLESEYSAFSADYGKISSGYEGERKVLQTIEQQNPGTWDVITNAVLPIVNPKNDFEKSIKEFENDFIIVCDKGVFSLEVKNYHSGSISITNDGQVIHKDKIGNIIKDGKQNVVEQNEKHKSYLMRFVKDQVPEINMDSIKSFIVFANNDFSVEQNDIQYPIYRDSLISNVISKLPVVLTEKEQELISKSITDSILPEHKFKFIEYSALEQEIENGIVEKIHEAIKEIEENPYF